MLLRGTTLCRLAEVPTAIAGVWNNGDDTDAGLDAKVDVLSEVAEGVARREDAALVAGAAVRVWETSAIAELDDAAAAEESATSEGAASRERLGSCSAEKVLVLDGELSDEFSEADSFLRRDALLLGDFAAEGSRDGGAALRFLVAQAAEAAGEASSNIESITLTSSSAGVAAGGAVDDEVVS
jgi:hypothetical protein